MYRVLLVDDDAHILSTNQTYLEKQGYQVVTATGGAEALAVAASAALDAMVLDVEMPGLELLQGFSRGERGMLPLQPICLNDFLRQFYEDNRPDMELSGQTFLLELPKAVLTVAGDEERLRSALENLCYNALSFTPEDGSVTLALREERGKAAISVTDTGAGIEPNHLPHVFDRGFTTAPTAAARAWVCSSSTPSPWSTAARWRPSPSSARVAPSPCACLWRSALGGFSFPAQKKALRSCAPEGFMTTYFATDRRGAYGEPTTEEF